MGIHDGHRENVRQRFLHGGLESFADHEVLELLLFYAIPRRDTNEIAHRLMERYGSLSDVLSAPIEDLREVDGIGEKAAILLHLVPQIEQRAQIQKVQRENKPLDSSERAGAYLLKLFQGEKIEVVYQLCLDRKGKLLACKRLAEGGSSSAVLNMRTLVTNALLTSASAVILSHNHPSGIALPSQDDYRTTDQVRAALAAVGVELTDHIIVADGDFVSLADSGYFSR